MNLQKIVKTKFLPPICYGYIFGVETRETGFLPYAVINRKKYFINYSGTCAKVAQVPSKSIEEAIQRCWGYFDLAYMSNAIKPVFNRE